MSGATCRRPVVTIDGPAGAGKSTVARELARRLGFKLIDTGAMYRALAWAVREAGIAPTEGPALDELIERTTVGLDESRVLVNGRDVTGEIRSPEVGELTSTLTGLASVRNKMTPIQRVLAAAGGVVLEGRDTGSVVCPDAEVKFYLDADLDTRSRRRQDELAARGIHLSLEGVREEVTRRDRQDMGRALAPLVKPEGAIVVDSSERPLSEVVLIMADVVAETMERVGCSTRS